MRDPKERFYEKFRKEKSGCWFWTASTFAFGYGKFRIKLNGKWRMMNAHRVSWFLHVGDPGELSVLHECDVPRCVNPKHLFLGTQKENIRDMHKKNRYGFPRASGKRSYLHNHPEVVQGERNGRAKLTAPQVQKIRREYANTNTTYKKLAEKYGVDFTSIGEIVRGESWRSIPFA